MMIDLREMENILSPNSWKKLVKYIRELEKRLTRLEFNAHSKSEHVGLHNCNRNDVFDILFKRIGEVESTLLEKEQLFIFELRKFGYPDHEIERILENRGSLKAIEGEK